MATSTAKPTHRDSAPIAIWLPRPLWILTAAVLPLACNNAPEKTTDPATERTATAAPAGESPRPSSPSSAEQEKEIRSLIEQLVFSEQKARKEPLLSPGIADKTDAYRKRFERCASAFEKLYEFKEVAFPFLVEHLDDDRQSIPFRNHFLGQSVGNACYWNIYFQLQDRPDDYSSYGYSRKGRDGRSHPKPYGEGTPFDDAGGAAKWLDQNRELSYTQKQVKCLRWLLDREKAIGACDPESYFENILPLEVRIAERRLQAGEDVQSELDRLRLIRDEKRVAEIPAEYLPDE